MNRLVSVRLAALVLGAAGVLAQAQQAVAGPTVPHREKCDGAVAFPSPTTLTFQGRGNATHMGRYLISGGNEVTPDGLILNGTFTSVAADGSTISGVYAGTYTPLPNGTVRFDVNVQWLVGTKRLAGVTGQAAVVAIVDPAAGTFHYDTLGTWTLP